MRPRPHPLLPRIPRPRRIARCALAACAATLLLALPTPAHAAPCLPSFPYQGGWLGGDGAFSIPLNPGRELWLFGDTFVGRSNKKTREGSTMVANTIAISTCRGGKWSIRYYWRPPIHGRKPRAFFEAGSNAVRYWPMDGFVYDGALYIALLRVKITDPNQLFGFKLVGVHLARIANPDADPAQWSVAYLPLSRSEQAFPGVSIVVQPPYVYMFGVMDRDGRKHTVILTRLRLDRLAHPADALEYLATAGTGGGRQAQPKNRWVQGSLLPLIGADALEPVTEGQADFSVRYHREIGKWVMVQHAPGYLTDEIGIRTSSALEGPWSAFQSLTHEPKTHSDQARHKRFCYAAKEHPSFESTPGTLVVTYVYSSLSFHAVVWDMSLYRVIVSRLLMPTGGRP